MGLTADLAFGTEPITVGDITKSLDVCGLADDLYDALQGVPEGTDPIKAPKLEAAAVNKVLVGRGFPEITGYAAAGKFAQQILHRAVTLGKEAGNVWNSDAGLALPNDSQDSTFSG